MRFIEIDGKRYDVPCCNECPCYASDSEDTWEECKHPKGNGEPAPWGGGMGTNYGPKCRRVPETRKMGGDIGYSTECSRCGGLSAPLIRHNR